MNNYCLYRGTTDHGVLPTYIWVQLNTVNGVGTRDDGVGTAARGVLLMKYY